MTLIFLDTANFNDIDKYYGIGLISGITTNPQLLSKEAISTGVPANQILDKIFERCSDIPISIQVISNSYDLRKSEIDKILNYKDNSIVKLPPDELSMKLLNEYRSISRRFNITGIFTSPHLHMFSQYKPGFMSLILGKNEDWGIQFPNENKIKSIVKSFPAETKLILASIRNTAQYEICLNLGADILTIPPSTLELVANNIRSNDAISGMNKAWSALPNELTKNWI